MFFAWDDTYNTDIEVIDTQHRQIVDYINKLHGAISTQNKHAVDEVLESLIDYTISHFSFEEVLMENHGYPLAEAHRRVHQAFTDRIMRYQQEWAEGKDISRRLLNDLKIWLISHIQKEDQDYAREIRNKVNKGWVSKMLGRFFK